MLKRPSPGYSITVRVEIDKQTGMFTKLATAIGDSGGDISSFDIVRAEKGKLIRDITVNARDEKHEHKIVHSVKRVPGVRVMRVMDRTFSSHRGGKIEIRNKAPMRDRNDLSQVYTPGVARICRDIQAHSDHIYRYTIKGNSVAIVTDGTAVLGLGNIGPEAALPVMEGKAMIFKEFANIDAIPIVLDTVEPCEIINTVRHISRTFGGINLEDISAPRCFEIEERLQRELEIPVFHDDQHGTAAVVLSALINVGRLYKKDIRRFRVVVVGAGAAGYATALTLSKYGVRHLLVCDRKGIIYKGRRTGMNPYKRKLASVSNPQRIKGSISDALEGADVVIGLSAPNTISPDDVKRMSQNPVIFALANPDPDISPEDALPLAKVLATGRSDYPNQINNMLGFPGIFRGLLDVKAKGVNDAIKLASANAIAYTIKDDELQDDYIMPSIFDKKIVTSVAHNVAEAARKTGLSR